MRTRASQCPVATPPTSCFCTPHYITAPWDAPDPGAGYLMSRGVSHPCSCPPRPCRRRGAVRPRRLWSRVPCGPGPSLHPRSHAQHAGYAPRPQATNPFPYVPDRDTIPIAHRPPVCVQHAQAGRFSSTRFTRRARPSGRWAVLRGARRVKAYSFDRE